MRAHSPNGQPGCPFGLLALATCVGIGLRAGSVDLAGSLHDNHKTWVAAIGTAFVWTATMRNPAPMFNLMVAVVMALLLGGGDRFLRALPEIMLEVVVLVFLAWAISRVNRAVEAARLRVFVRSTTDPPRGILERVIAYRRDRAERRAFEVLRAKGKPESVGAPGLPLPWSLVLSPLLTGLLLLLCSKGLGLAILGTAGAVLGGFRWMKRAQGGDGGINARRAVKYEIVATVLPMMIYLFPMLLTDKALEWGAGGSSFDATVWLRVTPPFLPICFLMGAIQVVLSALLKPWRGRERRVASPMLRRAWGVSMWLVPLVALTSQAFLYFPLVYALLVARYALGVRMRLHPIVYLRSFDHPDVHSSFAAVVEPAASRLGVLVGLAHPRQPPEAMLPPSRDDVADGYSVARVGGAVDLSAVSDDAWKDWVREQLHSAAAVIVDRTVSSEGLEWELRQALKIVPRGRILVLHREGSDLRLPVRRPPRQMSYSLGAGIEAARIGVEQWLHEILLKEQPSTRRSSAT